MVERNIVGKDVDEAIRRPKGDGTAMKVRKLRDKIKSGKREARVID